MPENRHRRDEWGLLLILALVVAVFVLGVLVYALAVWILWNVLLYRLGVVPFALSPVEILGAGAVIFILLAATRRSS